jgi:hypothetical protein
MKTILRTTLKKSFTSLLILALATGCGSSASFSVMGEENSFSQAPTEVYGKVDVLWVVDNSGSMKSSQQDLIKYMSAFTQEFMNPAKQIDFRMAVVTTDAYRSLFGSASSVSEFRKNSGSAVVTPATLPNPKDALIQNIDQGTSGNGDERAFQSFKVALEHSINDPYKPFPRPDAHLAVVILSDEDDYSHDNSNFIGGTAGDMSVYDNPALHPISMYTNYLAAKTNGNYAVHAITILDETCRAQRNAVNGGQRIGVRYVQIAQATGGETASLCSDFSGDLQRIAIKSILRATRFELNREPNPATIQIWIDGVAISEDANNGWTYSEENGRYFVDFHGAAVPEPGERVTVHFDPVSIK